MALQYKELERSFTFKKGQQTITLGDPDPAMSPDEVMSFYANTYAELTTATVQGPEVQNDKAVYKFTTTIGTKG